MLMGVRCKACVVWVRMTRKRRIRTDASEEPDLSLIVHPTSEVLSQKRAAWVFYRLDVRHYSASQLITSPASSRLLMVRVPDLNSPFTLCGHSYFQMIGPILFKLDVWTPPMKIPQLPDYLM